MKTKDNASIKENSILKDYESKREKVVRGGITVDWGIEG